MNLVNIKRYPIPGMLFEAIFLGDCYDDDGDCVARNVLVTGYYKYDRWWLFGSSGKVSINPTHWAYIQYQIVN